MRPIGARLPDLWKSLVEPGWLLGWEPRPFELRGGTTEVVSMGEGPLLLLVPPLPGFKEAFVGAARLLARDFRVVTFDLRARFDGRPTWEALLEDLERIAEAVAPEPFLLAGHSLGGALAQRYALAHPERVKALVLSSSFAAVGRAPGLGWNRYVEQPVVIASQRWLPGPAARPLARRLAAREAWVFDRRCDDRLLDFVRLGIRSLPIPVAWQFVDLARSHDARAMLGGLRLPILLLVGERETAWSRGCFEELSRLVPHAERRVAPGVSHLHPLSAPEWFAETVSGWGERAVAQAGRVPAGGVLSGSFLHTHHE